MYGFLVSISFMDRNRQKGKNLDAMKVEGIVIKLGQARWVDSGPNQLGPRPVQVKEK